VLSLSTCARSGPQNCRSISDLHLKFLGSFIKNATQKNIKLYSFVRMSIRWRHGDRAVESPNFCAREGAKNGIWIRPLPRRATTIRRQSLLRKRDHLVCTSPTLFVTGGALSVPIPVALLRSFVLAAADYSHFY
jgi:hypothetical protein